jgi:hypothetical protein
MVHKVEIVGDIQLCAGRSLQASNHIKRAAGPAALVLRTLNALQI